MDRELFDSNENRIHKQAGGYLLMEKLTLRKKIKVLEHAFAGSAGAYYSINLTKNLVPGTMYQVIDDEEYSINEQIGMPDNAAFSDVVEYWGSKLEEKEKKEYFEFLKISNLLEHYEKGQKHVSHRYWTKTALFEPMLAEQHIVMFKDEENQDILAITYVLDLTQEYKKQQYSELLEQKNEELEHMLEVERNYSEIMSALSKVYWQIYSIDLLTDTYIEVFNGYGDENRHLCRNDRAQESFYNILNAFVSKEYLDIMNAFLNHKTLAGRLSNTDSISLDFYATMGQWLCATYIAQKRDENGNVTNVLFTIKNIDEQKQQEFKQQELLRKTAVAADAANRAKSAFLFNMSHDIRTPLNGITGLLKIDKAHFDDYELVKENHEKMLISADHLLSLINDVLEMSKLEDGSVQLSHDIVDLVELSDEVGTIIKVRTEAEGISFEVGIQELPVPYVYGSPTHLRKIFLNIYGNCIKYNKMNGSLKTTMKCLGIEENTVTYQWHISDTGIGMSEEFIDHIYEPFVQEHSEDRGEYHGTGLGMAIVKGLVDQMKGTIEISSEKGVGTTFIITIPFEIAEKPEESINLEEVNADISGFSLLLVEDNELNAEIAEMILKDHGAKVTLATDGSQAVSMFEKCKQGDFDAILMDVMMPVMNGLVATKKIRSMEREDAKTIPIIAMTANAFKEDEQKCIEAGMNAHLVKPLHIKKVIATIAHFCKRRDD